MYMCALGWTGITSTVYACIGQSGMGSRHPHNADQCKQLEYSVIDVLFLLGTQLSTVEAKK